MINFCSIFLPFCLPFSGKKPKIEKVKTRSQVIDFIRKIKSLPLFLLVISLRLPALPFLRESQKGKKRNLNTNKNNNIQISYLFYLFDFFTKKVNFPSFYLFYPALFIERVRKVKGAGKTHG